MSAGVHTIAGASAVGAARVPAAAGSREAVVARRNRQTGAVPSLEQVLSEHGPMLSRLAATYEFDPARREELLQEIALALWQALPGFEARASLKTFVARIAHNRAVSHIVREQRHAPVAALDEEPPAPADSNPAHQVAAAEQRELLQAAVRRLPINQRQVLTLALEGFSNIEIGEALGLTPGNVAVRLTRARSALAQRLRGRAG